MISTILTYLYAALFGFSSCYEMFKGKGMPIWLFLLNIGSCLLMALKPLSKVWLVTGLILAIVSALLNGWLILGTIHLSHVIVRLILSALIIWLAFSNY